LGTRARTFSMATRSIVKNYPTWKNRLEQRHRTRRSDLIKVIKLKINRRCLEGVKAADDAVMPM
jgi:hypothetical protein